MGLTELLLTEAKVAVLPGITFGADGYLRLSCATSMKIITDGTDHNRGVSLRRCNSRYEAG